jgi:hypothetical protein
MPFLFTEYGVALLSSVLRSIRAIKVNTQIMLVFSRIREMLIDSLRINSILKKSRNRIGFKIQTEKQ